MTQFEDGIWVVVFGSLLAQRGWPISTVDRSDAIRCADSAILAIRGLIECGRLHEDDKLEVERLAQQPCPLPENAVELATRLRTELVETGRATVYRGDIMPLLDMVIGSTQSTPGHQEDTAPTPEDNPRHPHT